MAKAKNRMPRLSLVLFVAVERDDLVSGRVGSRRAARDDEPDHGENDKSDPTER